MTIVLSTRCARTLAVLDAVAIPAACVAGLNMLHIRAGLLGGVII